MPINSIVKRYKPGRGMEQIGRIHKGAERTKEDIEKKRPGKDLDHFRVTFNEAYSVEHREALEQVWEYLHGKNPSTLRGGRLIGDGVDDAFSAWYEEWGKSGLFTRCNGDERVTWFDKSKGSLVHDHPQPCLMDAPHPCQCKQVGRINIWFPEFTARTGIYGYFTLITHSIREIGNTTALLMDVHTTAGTLSGMPILVYRAPDSWEIPELDRQTKKPTGNRTTITKSLVFIRPDEDYIKGVAQAALASGSAPALPEPPKALPAPEGDGWTEAEAKRWVEIIRKDVALNDREILEALGVSKLSEWRGDAVSASQRISAWIDAQF